jgi:ABC-type amino acid transport substrate-binding protein
MSDIIPSSPTTLELLDETSGRALVEAWLASGLNGAEFCRGRNLRPQRLHYWRERLGYPIRVVSEPSSAPRRSSSVGSVPVAEGFVQVVVGDALPSATTYVDIVVGGASLRVHAGFDVALVRSVVQALRADSSAC